MVTDVVLVSSVWYATRQLPARRRDAAFALAVASAGLLIVDHIHFQYNGLLLGDKFLASQTHTCRMPLTMISRKYVPCPRGKHVHRLILDVQACEAHPVIQTSQGSHSTCCALMQAG